MWDEIVATVGRQSKRAAAVVREATVRDVEGDTIVLLFQHTVHANMLSSSPRALLDAVHEVLGGSWQIRCEARDTPAGAAATARGARAPARNAPTPGQPAAGAAPPTPATDGDWPEPARLGGTGAEAATPVGVPPQEPAGGDRAVPDYDEVDEIGDARTPMGAGEEQTIALLQQTLGAQKIGEATP